MVTATTPADVDPEDPNYVVNPVTGERFLFAGSVDDPGVTVTFDVWAAPGMTPLKEHVHPDQVETFTVESGAIEMSRSGTVERFDSGAKVTVPAGTPHSWWTAGEEDAHLTLRFEPGLQIERFLRDLATLAQRGEVTANGAPSLLQIAAMYDAYGFQTHLASPPLVIQRLLFGALAPVAKLLGYRADPVRGRTE